MGDANMVLNEKNDQKSEITGLKLRRLRQNQISIPNYLYQNDQHKRYTHLPILGGKHPRIRLAPTQFQHFGINSKIDFPGNWAKILPSPESAEITESVLSFKNKKNAHTKKVLNPGIQPKYMKCWRWRAIH